MTANQHKVILHELGEIKGDLTFFENHNLNTNYKSSEHHRRTEQSRKSIQKIQDILNRQPDSITN